LTEFHIFETAEFERSLKRLDAHSKNRLRVTLRKRVYPQLCEQPFWGPNIKKLRDFKPDTWRYRIGDFRLFYTIDTTEKIVSILAIENRKDAYKQT
jgi:mRNA interferase RelE/StbE